MVDLVRRYTFSSESMLFGFLDFACCPVGVSAEIAETPAVSGLQVITTASAHGIIAEICSHKFQGALWLHSFRQSVAASRG
jgi:hypothetical protein